MTDLRLGENPHQRGALYAEVSGSGCSAGRRVLQGKEMSYNNWLDLVAAYSLAAELPSPAAVIVKHNNPCGVALGESFADAYTKAFTKRHGVGVQWDRGVQRRGGRRRREAMAEVFTEVVVAPSFTPEAMATFADQNLRVVRAPLPSGASDGREAGPRRALVQDADAIEEAPGRT